MGRSKASSTEEAVEGEFSNIPRAFAAKDVNSKKGFNAFSGYSEARMSPPLPLSSMPYHHMGLSPEDVNSMDQYYKELRDLKDETMRKNNEVREMYKKVRQQYKTSAQENLRIGSLKPLEELLPSERH